MYRRSFIALVAMTAGCTSVFREANSEDGGKDTTETNGQLNESPTTPTETGTGTTTSSPTTSDECSPVETEFSIPDVSKPSPLTTESVQDPILNVEGAYEDTLDISRFTWSDVPDDARNFQFNLYKVNTEATAVDGGFRVNVKGRATYKTGGSGDETEVHRAEVLQAATYHVTDRRISRESGIGDLTGTLVCW